VVATVLAVDPQEQTLKLEGPGGRAHVLKVKDPEVLHEVKAGGQMKVVYTEALAIAVGPAR